MSRGLVPWGGELPRTLTGLRREMDTLFDHFFRDESGLAERFAPRINLAETENEYEVTMELPGMKPEDFEVELQNGQLLIRGEKRNQEETTEKRFHRVERFYGQFQRVIPLAGPVNEGKISADYNDGVLTVSIPKAEEAKPKKINVKSSKNSS